MRAVHRGIGAEQYPFRARPFNQPYYLTPATPGRFQIEVRLFTDVPVSTQLIMFMVTPSNTLFAITTSPDIQPYLGSTTNLQRDRR